MRRKKNGATAPKRQRDIEALKKILGGEEFPYRYQGSKVSIRDINVLPQPRKTFENIPELADDISRKGILNPPTVARLNALDVGKYLTIVNMLWSTDFGMKDLAPATTNGNSRVYYVLLAGERRFRASKHLWEHGCGVCSEKYGEEEKGVCFKRHFGGERIEVRLCNDIPPLPALFIQLSENTHMQVPPHEEAKAYSQLFRLIREADSKFTLVAFARNVGRSADTVRKALKFCELPADVQEAVEVGLVPYGIALELSRLHQDGMGEEELGWWLRRAVAENARIPVFRESVSKHLLDKHSGQGNLLLMSPAAEADNRRRQMRQVVESSSVQVLWTFIHYAEKLFQLFERGDLGKKDSPFSEGSPRRVLRNLIGKERKLLVHLRAILPKYELQAMPRLLDRADSALDKLEVASSSS